MHGRQAEENKFTRSATIVFVGTGPLDIGWKPASRVVRGLNSPRTAIPTKRPSDAAITESQSRHHLEERDRNPDRAGERAFAAQERYGRARGQRTR